MDVHLCAKKNGNLVSVWDVETLRVAAANLPISHRNIEEFDLQTMNFFASYDDANLKSFIDHMCRIDAADVRTPLILSSNGDIFDGMHRLVKACRLQMAEIAIVQFRTDPPPLRIIEV